MKSKCILLTLFVVVLGSCGKKEETKVCAVQTRKDFTSANISATVENGCLIKYVGDDLKADGTITLKINSDGKEKKVKLSKGVLLTTESETVIQSEPGSLKIRLLSGSGVLDYNKQKTPLEINKVINIGK